MASITITIPNSATTRVLNAICQQGGYQPFLSDGVTPNPMSQSQFSKNYIINYVKRIVVDVETRNAFDATQSDVGGMEIS